MIIGFSWSWSPWLPSGRVCYCQSSCCACPRRPGICRLHWSLVQLDVACSLLVTTLSNLSQYLSPITTLHFLNLTRYMLILYFQRTKTQSSAGNCNQEMKMKRPPESSRRTLRTAIQDQISGERISLPGLSILFVIYSYSLYMQDPIHSLTPLSLWISYPPGSFLSWSIYGKSSSLQISDTLLTKCHGCLLLNTISLSWESRYSDQTWLYSSTTIIIKLNSLLHWTLVRGRSAIWG